MKVATMPSLVPSKYHHEIVGCEPTNTEDIRAFRQAKADAMDRIKIANDRNWYAVLWLDGKVSCRHATGLSSILECGAALADYDIAAIEQCGD